MTAIATYNPPPTLNRRTATSFFASDVFSLARYLMLNKFASVSPSCGDPRIFGRFSLRAGAQVILYHSGAIVAKGDDAAAFLAALCDDEGGAL